jgi:hypothetical protein
MPQLYRDLFEQLRQWVCPKDPRHLQVYAESLGGMLSTGSACMSHWLPYLSQPFGNAVRTRLPSTESPRTAQLLSA